MTGHLTWGSTGGTIGWAAGLGRPTEDLFDRLFSLLPLRTSPRFDSPGLGVPPREAVPTGKEEESKGKARMMAMDPDCLALDVASVALTTPYQEFRVLWQTQFESALRDRQLDFDLLTMWRLGVLRPIAVQSTPKHAAYRNMFRQVPGESDFYADCRLPPVSISLGLRGKSKALNELLAHSWYHPFQIRSAWRYSQLLNAMRLDPATFLGKRAGVSVTGSFVRRFVRQAVTSYLHGPLLYDDQLLLLFLIAAAPLVTVGITGQLVKGIGDDVEFEDYWTWRRSHDLKPLLERYAITGETLQRWHETLAIDASLMDPASSWFELTRNITFGRWRQVTGKFRLAQDFYTMAEIIRLYARHHLDLRLPEEDEARHGPYAATLKQRMFGSPEVTARSRHTRRRISRYYGLDGGVRVIWFVEGATEVAFVSRFCELAGWKLDEGGIETVDLYGHGGLRGPWFGDRLDQARKEDTFTYVTLDHEPDVPPALRGLAAAGRITGGFTIWKADVEFDNFSEGEIASLVNEWADESGITAGLTGDGLCRLRQLGYRNFSEVVREALKGVPFWPGKGAEWGERLARWAIDHKCPPELAIDGERPIVDTLMMLVRSSSADFLGSVEQFQVGPDGKIGDRPPPGPPEAPPGQGS
jgi:hypothetical protein